MTEASVSFAGNLTDHPEVRYTEGGIARAMVRVAVSGRREQGPSFFTVVRPSRIACLGPFVVVDRWPPHDEAAVVRRAPTQDSCPPGRPAALDAPVVGDGGQLVGVQEVARPAALGVGAVVGTGLDQAHRPVRVIAQACGQHTASRSAANDNDVVALHGHAPPIHPGPFHGIDRAEIV
jgi:hypothetical protein